MTRDARDVADYVLAEFISLASVVWCCQSCGRAVTPLYDEFCAHCGREDCRQGLWCRWPKETE